MQGVPIFLNNLSSASRDPEGWSIDPPAAARTSSAIDPLQQLVQLCQQQVKDAAQREEKMAQVLDLAQKKEGKSTVGQAVKANNQISISRSKVNVTPLPLSAKSTVAKLLTWRDPWKNYKLCQNLNSLHIFLQEMKVVAMRQCLDEDLKHYLWQGIIQNSPNSDDCKYLLEKYARKQHNLLFGRIDFYSSTEREPSDSYFLILTDLCWACDFPIDTLRSRSASYVYVCGGCTDILEWLQDEVLRDRIVTGSGSQETRRHLLATPS